MLYFWNSPQQKGIGGTQSPEKHTPIHFAEVMWTPVTLYPLEKEGINH